ncbi:MAG TPA: NAD(P)/FAD-dependent oxidoreductase [Amycolatopsis sp.]|nr:NAD(P)/FAD-dependent oxidoreductase [Amycolatopsis sp.]
MTRPGRAGLPYDVIVIGGGAAGLNAALMLGRARRSVLVLDDGHPRNAPAAHTHGFLSRDGSPPGEFRQAARREVTGYGGKIIDARVTAASRRSRGFAVELDDGRTMRSRRLLVATGITDELPGVPGITARWGRDVLHCPYCHGWEVRDQPIGVLGPADSHRVLLLRQWTDKLTLLTHTGPEPTADDAARFTARDIRVVRGEVSTLDVVDDRLTGVRLRSGTKVPLRALVVAPRSVPRAGALATLGVTPVPHPTGHGEYIAADAAGRTPAPGVWVAGNLADPSANLLAAAASGATAAVAINADLVQEDTDHALEDPFSPTVEAALCEDLLGERRHGL